MEKFISLKIKDNNQFLAKIKKFLPKYKIFLLVGELGSGKTTLIKQLARDLKIKKTLTSPTFVIWQKYRFFLKNKNYFFNHLDLYRLKVPDIKKLGFLKEIENKENIFFIEWGEKIKNFLKKKKKKFILLKIKKVGGKRFFFLNESSSY